MRLLIIWPYPSFHCHSATIILNSIHISSSLVSLHHCLFIDTVSALNVRNTWISIPCENVDISGSAFVPLVVICQNCKIQDAKQILKFIWKHWNYKCFVLVIWKVYRYWKICKIYLVNLYMYNIRYKPNMKWTEKKMPEQNGSEFRVLTLLYVMNVPSNFSVRMLLKNIVDIVFYMYIE